MFELFAMENLRPLLPAFFAVLALGLAVASLLRVARDTSPPTLDDSFDINIGCDPVEHSVEQ